MAKARKSKPVWSEKTKARIAGYVEKWRGILFLNGYQLEIEWHDEERQREAEDGDSTCSAAIQLNGSYMSGHLLKVYPHLLLSNVDDQERAILHEIVHLMTSPIVSLTHAVRCEHVVTAREVTAADEHLTDWIANIVAALYDGRHL